MKLVCESTSLREMTAQGHPVPSVPCTISMGGREKTQGQGPSWKHEPGGGRVGCSGSESGSVCLDCALSCYRSSLLQRDVCFPRCESNIMGSPVLPTMSFSGQYSCSLQSVLFTASPAELYRATTRREKAVSPGQLLITKNDGSVSLLSSHVEEATESSDSHGLSFLLLDYNCNDGSR